MSVTSNTPHLIAHYSELDNSIKVSEPYISLFREQNNPVQFGTHAFNGVSSQIQIHMTKLLSCHHRKKVRATLFH